MTTCEVLCAWRDKGESPSRQQRYLGNDNTVVESTIYTRCLRSNIADSSSSSWLPARQCAMKNMHNGDKQLDRGAVRTDKIKCHICFILATQASTHLNSTASLSLKLCSQATCTCCHEVLVAASWSLWQAALPRIGSCACLILESNQLLPKPGRRAPVLSATAYTNTTQASCAM